MRISVPYVDVNLTEEQLKVVRAIQSGFERVIRVSGPAGSGKSAMIKELQKQAKNILYCAPTGLASAAIGGSTVHKTFGVPTAYPLNPDSPASSLRGGDVSTRFFGGRRADPLRIAEWIVIDECSMLRADILDFINGALQHARGSTGRFGGAGMLLVGDDGQLPPVVTGADSATLDLWGYSSPYGISESRCMANVKTYALTRIFRQTARAEGELFSRVRTGQQSNLDLRILNRCVGPSLHGSVTLTPYVEVAKRSNLCALKDLGGDVFDFPVISKHWNGPPPVEPISLCRGARVVIKANGSWKAAGDHQSCVNGDQGTYYGCDKFGRMLIDVDGRGMINLPKKIWTQYRAAIGSDNNIRHVKSGQFKAFPVVLGWAMTIHAAQGSTLNRVYIDLPDRRPFTTGLLYVALSRVEAMSGLRLSRAVKHSDVSSAVQGELIADQDLLDF
jgi:ATP-dependent DNA helicase PIF1